MSTLAMDIARMVDMLPESDQNFAHEFIKKMVLAWDPDFTKATPDEAEQIAIAEASGFVDEEDIDWENLQKYAE